MGGWPSCARSWLTDSLAFFRGIMPRRPPDSRAMFAGSIPRLEVRSSNVAWVQTRLEIRSSNVAWVQTSRCTCGPNWRTLACWAFTISPWPRWYRRVPSGSTTMSLKSLLLAHESVIAVTSPFTLKSRTVLESMRPILGPYRYELVARRNEYRRGSKPGEASVPSSGGATSASGLHDQQDRLAPILGFERVERGRRTQLGHAGA